MAIVLAKQQAINLAKSDGSALSTIVMGLGWDVAKPKSSGFFGALFGGGGSGDSIDLDASAIGFDANGQRLDQAWFRQLSAFHGAVQHQGDNLTGEGEGDDETIVVKLNELPANLQTLVFTVNSFRGQTFETVENAYCRVVDQATGHEMARVNLSANGSHTGVVMAKVYREGRGWTVQALNELGEGRTFDHMLDQIRGLL